MRQWRRDRNLYFTRLQFVCVQFYHPLEFVSWVLLRMSIRQIWRRWVCLCGATSRRRSSWRASVRRSPTYCLIAEPEMGPLLCSSKSSTWPWLTLAWPATASLTQHWKRYSKRGIENLARDAVWNTQIYCRENTHRNTEYICRSSCPWVYYLTLLLFLLGSFSVKSEVYGFRSCSKMHIAWKDLVTVHQSQCWHLYILLFGLLWLFVRWPLSQAADALYWPLHTLPWTHRRWSALKQCLLPFSAYLEQLGCWDGAQSSAAWSRSAPIISTSVLFSLSAASDLARKYAGDLLEKLSQPFFEQLMDLWIRMVPALKALHEILIYF